MDEKMKSINNVEIKNEENSVIRLIKLEGAVIEGETLKNLQEQAGKIDEFDNLVMEIASPGGSVYEGLLIMVWMNLLSEMGKNVTTVVTANAYSIASLIMLAANNKLISNSADVMVHNPMVPEIQYANANDLELHLISLRNLEDVMYELYILFTDLSREEIKKLMDNETYLDAKQAVNYGFADKVVDIKKRQKSVVANIKKESNMKNTLNLLHRVIGMVNGAQFVNQLYYDDKGGEFEIFQKDPSEYQTGDRTSKESGEVKLSDGATITIEDFVITAIDKSIEPAPIVPVVEDLSYGKEKMEDAPVITNPAPAVDPKEKEKEVVAMDDPTKKEEMAMDPEKDKMAMDDPMKEREMVIEPVPEMDHSQPSITMEDFMKLQEIVDALVVEVNKLTEGNVAIDAKFVEAKAFEELAAQAIDTLANNTTSNFKPQAKASVSPVATGSIFKQAMQKAGL
jgi:ATP-dependent protease ClpP protease subunit